MEEGMGSMCAMRTGVSSSVLGKTKQWEKVMLKSLRVTNLLMKIKFTDVSILNCFPDFFFLKFDSISLQKALLLPGYR